MRLHKNYLYKFILFLFIFFQASYVFFVRLPLIKHVDTATLTSASATLSNSRLSYYAKVSGAHTAADTTITIQTSGNADNNTSHLFPNDTVSVGPNGDKTVATIIDSSNFALSSGITVGASNSDAIYATQSGILTIAFTVVSTIPANGYVKVTLPDPPSNGNDGAPDTTSSTTTNGFDLNGMTTSNTAVSGGTGCTWSGTETLTAGSGSGHTYKQVTTTACTGGTVTVTIGDGTKGLVNPAPVTSGHTQGTADVYPITVATFDSSDQQIDTVDIKVAPVEAVLVSATVDETLSFAVAAVAASTSTCGQTTDVTTTAYSIPWGTLSTANAFSEGTQQLTVSTNADWGYSVKIEENDQMGKSGVACTGAGAGESVNCIKDTTCDATCSESASTEWTTATNNGLGFSLANVSGTDASFTYNESARTFSSRQIADQEASETKANIMSNTGQVSGSSAYVCYRISISATQPAGYYYNKVKYTATATF